MQMRRILAPTDFSECSTQAVTCAYELAHALGAKLVADKNPAVAATVAKITIEVLPEVYPATEDEDND